MKRSLVQVQVAPRNCLQFRVLSSIGRAPALQAGGREFDSRRIHRMKPRLNESGFSVCSIPTGSHPNSCSPICFTGKVCAIVIWLARELFSEPARVLSSIGRAPALQAGGREFDSRRIHYQAPFERAGLFRSWGSAASLHRVGKPRKDVSGVLGVGPAPSAIT